MAQEKQWLQISGRLGKDVEEKISRKGTPYLSFRFASTCGNDTAWYSVLVFGDMIAPVRKFFKKGDAFMLNTTMLNGHTLKLLDFKFPSRAPKPTSSGEFDADEVDIDFDSIGEIKL